MASGDNGISSFEEEDVEVPYDDDGDIWDDDDDEQDDNVLVGPTQCLFCEETVNSALEVFSHCELTHSFSIQTICAQWHLDSIGYIKLINYIRTERPPPDFISNIARQTPELPWASDLYMQPARVDDLLLLFDVEDESFVMGAQAALRDAPSPNDEEITLKASHLEQLMQDLKSAQERADHAEERASNLHDTIESIKAGMQNLMSEPVSQGPNSGASGGTPVSAIKNLTEKEDEAYFSSYADYNIHGEMLKDRVRTESYRDFMYENPDLFRGKTVLDVGCGTGILSMFAVKAGASQVISVDQSEIIYQAMGIIRENKLEDKITCVKGRLEDVPLPAEKVDIIVSEWMGYFLLYESMLDTVVVARDHYLKPGGLVYPDKCSIWLCGLADADLWKCTIGYWDDVYGFSMSSMKRGTVEEPSVMLANKDKVITEHVKVKEIDVNTCTLSDLEFTSSFTLSCSGDGELTAVVGYFNIGFEAACTKQIHFSTSPADTPTHWKQTVFLLETPVTVSAGATLDGRIQVKKDIHDPRALVVKIRLGDKSKLYLMR